MLEMKEKELSESEKIHKIKLLVSQAIPRDGVGSFLRELIFTHAILDWDVVVLLVKKHFPEHTKDVNEILGLEV